MLAGFELVGRVGERRAGRERDRLELDRLGEQAGLRLRRDRQHDREQRRGKRQQAAHPCRSIIVLPLSIFA